MCLLGGVFLLSLQQDCGKDAPNHPPAGVPGVREMLLRERFGLSVGCKGVAFHATATILSSPVESYGASVVVYPLDTPILPFRHANIPATDQLEPQ